MIETFEVVKREERDRAVETRGRFWTWSKCRVTAACERRSEWEAFACQVCGREFPRNALNAMLSRTRDTNDVRVNGSENCEISGSQALAGDESFRGEVLVDALFSVGVSFSTAPAQRKDA